MCIMFREMETVFFIVWVSHFTVIWPCLVKQFQHHIEIQKYSSLSYFQHMILGNGYATSLEIDVAALLLQKQINVWLECKILAVHPIFLQHFNHLLNQIIFKSICYSKINIFNTWHLLWMIHKQANQKLIHPTIMQKHRKL